jgi:hypothetical protein
MHLDVSIQLFMEFSVLSAFVEQTGKPDSPFAQSSHRKSSFVTKRCHRIDPRRAASRKPAGEQTGEHQKCDDAH